MFSVLPAHRNNPEVAKECSPGDLLARYFLNKLGGGDVEILYVKG